MCKNIKIIRNKKTNAKFSLSEECHFDNPVLLRQLSAFFAFEHYDLCSFLEMFKVLNINLHFPIQIAGSSRRDLKITDLYGKKIILDLSCDKITVTTSNEDQDLIILVYSSTNFKLTSIEICRKNKQLFLVTLNSNNTELTFNFNETECIRVTKLPICDDNYNNIEFYFNLCSSFAIIFESSITDNREQETLVAFLTMLLFKACKQVKISYYKDNKLITNYLY